MAPKKKPAQEARERLSEKVGDVRVKSEKLHALINNITDLPVSRAEEALKEKSKTKFLAKYSKVSTELEVCLNQLLLVTDAISSLEDSDEDGDEDEDSEEDDSDSQATVSVITNATTVTLKGFESQETKFGSHESLTSIVSSVSAVDTYHRSVSETDSQHSIPSDTCVPVSSVVDVSIPVCSVVVSIPVISVVDVTIKGAIPGSAENVPICENAPSIQSPHAAVSLQKETECETSVENGTITEEVPKVEDLFPVLTDVNVQSFKWQLDVPYPVIVLDTYSPMNFYMQLVDQENDIMEQLCMHFLEEASIGYYGGINYVPTPNSFCCAKSSSNGPWYRARVISIYSQPKNDSGNIIMNKVLVRVFFIDEGYEDNVKLLHMRPLYHEFSMLPAQSIKCILGGVQPIEAVAQTKNLSFLECDEMWLAPSISFFKNLVQNGNICAAYFYAPPSIIHQPPHNVSPDTLVCDLYIVNPGCKVAWCKTSNNRLPIEDHVAFKMIANKMAAHCPFFNSELSHKNSMRILQQYLKPETSVVVIENCIVARQEHEEDNLQKVATKEFKHHDVTKEDNEECVPLPSSQRRDILRAKSEEKKDTIVNDESLRRSLEENINLNGFSGKSINKTPPRKLSPAERETNERRNDIIKKDPRWPADEKPFCTKNDNFFPTKKTADTKSTTPMRSDIKEEDTSVIYAETSPPTKPLELKHFTFGTSFNETVLTHEPESGFAKVLVSEVINPGLIYVHLVTEEVVLLDKLMMELNIYYNEKANDIRTYLTYLSEGYKYETGTAIAVLYSADKMWYRAVILSTRSTNDGKLEYEVLYVDFGSEGREWISGECILPIIEQFCSYPMEIVACCLADIKPCSNFVTKQVKGVSIRPAGFETPEYDSDNSQTDIKNIIPKWPQNTADRLKSLILTQRPILVSLKNAFKNSDGLYEVYLYDTADNKDIFINQLLVDEGLASSDVLTKVTPSVQVSEVELEEKIAEEKAMSEWDPMKEQYLSKRNVYSVDTDDPGVASMGYVQEKKSVCKNFFHRGHCYRGDNCKYVHAHPGDPKYDSVEVFCNDTILDLPKPERCVPVVIRALLDPTHFWVNFPYGIDWDEEKDENEKGNCGDEALEELHKQMEHYYSKLGHSRKTNLSILAEGELIAAKFHQDEQWYRARVINTADDLVQVFYVDYGNTDVITEDSTNALLPDFLHLPFQAVECFLFNTYMEEALSSQDEKFVDMRVKFRDMVADQVLMAYVVSSSITKSIVVMLYDTTTEPHTYINEVVRGWDGISHKGVKDIESLKDRLFQENDNSSEKMSYIPG